MNINEKTNETSAGKKKVKIIIEPIYIGKQSLSEAFMPLIYDELIKMTNSHTFDRCN